MGGNEAKNVRTDNTAQRRKNGEKLSSSPTEKKTVGFFFQHE